MSCASETINSYSLPRQSMNFYSNYIQNTQLRIIQSHKLFTIPVVITYCHQIYFYSNLVLISLRSFPQFTRFNDYNIIFTKYKTQRDIKRFYTVKNVQSEPQSNIYNVDTYAVLISGLSNATTCIGINDCIDCEGVLVATISKDFKND